MEFLLISFVEISVQILNSRDNTHEDFCLFVDLDGKNIHQVPSFKDGTRDHNTTRFQFHPPLLLWVEEATISSCSTKPPSSTVYLQSKFVVSLERVGSSCGPVSEVEWDFPSIFSQGESISSLYFKCLTQGICSTTWEWWDYIQLFIFYSKLSSYEEQKWCKCFPTATTIHTTSRIRGASETRRIWPCLFTSFVLTFGKTLTISPPIRIKKIKYSWRCVPLCQLLLGWVVMWWW